MGSTKAIAILIYGTEDSTRNALAEEKYKDLADSFISHGFTVQSVLYCDEVAGKLLESLSAFDAILVWVNPIEQGNDRKRLDAMLTDLSSKGSLVSANPGVILKMGTKDILFKTKEMDWGGDIEIYTSFENFTSSFPTKLGVSKVRVLKQYRGNGGNGVFKLKEQTDGRVTMIHAIAGSDERTLTWEELFDKFRPFFSNHGLLIDQEWNSNTANGMVRVYICGNKVAGFGYQEINALYELNDEVNNITTPPSKRYYFTENCGLFSDLKAIMEERWIPELQEKLDISDSMLPVIWDADFFINSISSSTPVGKYSLCEINVSCVSPFPPSAIKYIVDEVGSRLYTSNQKAPPK